MTYQDLQKQQTIISQYGSRYAAVIAISAEAKKLKEKSKGRFTESECISWAITGDRPKRNPKIRKQNDVCYLRNKLIEIGDETIASAVLHSIEASVSANMQISSCISRCSFSIEFLNNYILEHNIQLDRLVFKYSDNMNENFKARVRILTRMFVDNYNY